MAKHAKKKEDSLWKRLLEEPELPPQAADEAEKSTADEPEALPCDTPSSVGWRETPLPENARRRRRMRVYLLSYGTGVFTVRLWRRLLHWLYICLTPLGRFFKRLWDRLVLRQVRAVRWELHNIRYGFTLAGERVRQAAERSLLLAVVQAIALPFMALRRHRRFLNAVSQGLMLTGAVLTLLLVMRYWQDTTFALELVYEGRTIGYIAEETVFTEAVDMAEGRVLKTTEGYVIEREPRMTLRPVQQSAVLDKAELCDVILRLSDSTVTQMSGLYVDGAFEGALTTHERLQALLDEILAEYDTDAETSDKRAEFMSRVEIVDGLYPVSAEETYEAMLTRLTARDENGNPYLGVQIRCTEVYTEAIPFESETVRDSTKYIGYSEIRVKGEEGVRQYTADVIYVNGEELYREILSNEVIKEPVTEVTAIGSYRVNASAQAGVATGDFMWPLPSCHTVYSGYGYRWGKLHAGIDISGNGVDGKDILATDGGRVLQVNSEGWGGGYGLYVILDHGNGYTSVYAHCSEILVNEGDRVTQGQLIARVGNTGNSYGAHLHFEIRINGTSVDPVPYVK